MILPKMKKILDKLVFTMSFRNKKQKNTINSIMGDNNTVTNNFSYHKKYDYTVKCICGSETVEFDCELYIKKNDVIVVSRNEEAKRLERTFHDEEKPKDFIIYDKNGRVFKEIKNAILVYGTGPNEFYIAARD